MTFPESKQRKCCVQYNNMPRTSLPEFMTVAMAYVPFQQMLEIYETEDALAAGTLFPELDKPFMCGRRTR